MNNRSIYNMIISIITAVLLIPLLILGIIHNVSLENVIGIVLLPIIYLSLGVALILKSIDYATASYSKDTVLERISNSFILFSVSLICINFTLLLNNAVSWILFSAICLLGILEIVFSAINVLKEVRYLMVIANIVILFSVLYTLQGINIVTMLSAIAMSGCLLCHILGKELNNKYILSFEKIFIIIFGIILIFI